jgi:tRNA 2-selenouridine synthase
VEEWWQRRKEFVVIDVRTKKEYEEDHIPSAISFPVLNNEEREEVGKLYHKNPFYGRILGARYISKNIAHHLQNPELHSLKDQSLLIYCFRGGLRSFSFGIVLKEIGFKITLLQGGYKAFRKKVVHDLSSLPIPEKVWVLTGPTGSGKTELLHHLKLFSPFPDQWFVLNLEEMANHKGSLFGGKKENQPSQKAFETSLWYFFQTLPPTATDLFVEDESRKIGKLYLPDAIYKAIQRGRPILVTAPLQERIARILKQYSPPTPEEWEKIRSHLIPLLGKEKVGYLQKLYELHEWEEMIRFLLQEYYDPLYYHTLRKRWSHLPLPVT